SPARAPTTCRHHLHPHIPTTPPSPSTGRIPPNTVKIGFAARRRGARQRSEAHPTGDSEKDARLNGPENPRGKLRGLSGVFCLCSDRHGGQPPPRAPSALCGEFPPQTHFRRLLSRKRPCLPRSRSRRNSTSFRTCGLMPFCVSYSARASANGFFFEMK